MVQRRLRGRQRARRGVGGILASIASPRRGVASFRRRLETRRRDDVVDGRLRRLGVGRRPFRHRELDGGHDRRTRVARLRRRVERIHRVFREPRRRRRASFENLGAPIVEAAALGLSASLATDPARVALNVESRLLLDFLNHDKGAWEPLVEPWRIRVGVDVTLTSDAAPSRASATFAGVDALELVATEAAPPRLPRRRRRCAAAPPRTPRRTRREATTRTGYETPRAFLSSIGSPRMNRRRRTTNRARRPNRRRRTSSHPEDARCYTSPR